MQKSLFVLALSAALAQQAAAASGNYVRFVDRDSGGGALYYGAPAQTLSETACQQVCTADPTCFGYTFVPSTNILYPMGNCYRKGTNNCDANAIMTNAPGKYSGLIGSSCTLNCGGKAITATTGCSVVTPSPTSTSLRLRLKRTLEEAASAKKKLQLCPSKLTACSLNGLSTGAGYECVNLQEELERCGDCNNDCTAIPGAKGVACNQGRCVVSSCERGYKLVGGGDRHCERAFKRAEIPKRRLSHANHVGSL